MRLAILNITAGGLSGGYRKYLDNIIPFLIRHKDVSELLIAAPEGVLTCDWRSKYSSVKWVCLKPKLWFLSGIGKNERSIIANFNPDLVFIPTSRFWKTGNIPTVNMVRNMEPFVPNIKGDTIKEKFKKFVQRKLTGIAVKRADHIIAVSEYVKDYLVNTLGVDHLKVSRIYHGLSFSADGKCSRPVPIPTDWGNDFLFACGSIRPARGIEDALEALNLLKMRFPNLRLVIAGETSPGMKKYRYSLERSLTSKGLAERVCWAGFLNDEEMRWCYKKCRLFLMTSRIEACPNIAIEALSNGAISIVADNPPLPEFFSGLATYYKPNNAQSLTTAILGSLSLDERQRNHLSEQSQLRSKQFSWERTAEMTLTVLLQILNRLQVIEKK
jgi:glycosyltransferase involved in cell wall biosynthesis